MSMTTVHPAPGLGDLLPGFFVVPNNPLKPYVAITDVERVPHVGELMPGHWTVPQNPLMDAIRTVGKGKGDGGCVGLGCAGNGSLSGLGEFSFSSVGTSVSNFFTSVSPMTWVYIGVGVVALVFLMQRTGGSGYRDAVGAAKARYRADVAKARSTYRRRGRALGDAGAAAGRAARAALA